ncbi:MAG: DUF58 domain-containing protein [Candidatus Dormibacteraeota bacterium]|nr:DUF58 domain-containing protein [Candidatus Dormibacteraeota bacterium]
MTLVAAALLCAGAFLLGYPELAVPATAAVLAVLAGVAWSIRTPSLKVSREIAPTKVARGEAAVGVLSVSNAGRRRRAGVVATDLVGGSSVSVEVPGLSAGGRRTVTYRLPTERRGRVAVGPLRLVRADPLGLARRVALVGGVETLLVRPRVHPLPLLPVGRTRHLEGSTSDAALSGTATFHSLREYVPGDDLRHIHWRSSARLGTLMTRELVDASRPYTTIVLDLRPASYGDPGTHPEGGDQFELAVDAAASIAVAAGRHSHPVRIVGSNGPLLETKGGRGDEATLLDRLALVTPDPAGSLAGAFETLRRSRSGGLLVVVSGRCEDGELRRVSPLRARFDRIVAVSVGGVGEHPGVGALIAASSPQELLAGWQRESVR